MAFCHLSSLHAVTFCVSVAFITREIAYPRAASSSDPLCSSPHHATLHAAASSPPVALRSGGGPTSSHAPLAASAPPPAPSRRPSPSAASLSRRSAAPAAAYALSLDDLRDRDYFCRVNPFVSWWDDAAFASAASSVATARLTPGIVSNEVRNLPLDAARFSASTPPLVSACADTERLVQYPVDAQRLAPDGSKWVCALDTLRAPCVIYSIGSQLEFDFERSVAEGTPCEVHTFDCTVDPVALPPLPRSVHFHPYCIGARDGHPDARYRTLRSLMSQLGHDARGVSLLKMDIEGYEHRVLDSLLDLVSNATACGGGACGFLLPHQMAFELHLLPWWAWERRAREVGGAGGRRVRARPGKGGGPHVPQLPPQRGAPPPQQQPQEQQQPEGGHGAGAQDGLTTAELVLFWRQLGDLGYVPVSREDNVLCPTCSEFTVVRAFC